MGELASLFDAFYYRFLLRDFLAKVTPGVVVLISVFLTLSGTTEKLIDYLAILSFWTWILIIALGWIVGIATQGLGEILHLIRYYPKWLDKNKKKRLEHKAWLKMFNNFLKNPIPSEERNFERLVVIKEACGNGYVALIISIFFLFLGILKNIIVSKCNFLNWLSSNVIPLFPVLIFVLILILSLAYMHYVHVQRQFDYMVECLRERGE